MAASIVRQAPIDSLEALATAAYSTPDYPAAWNGVVPCVTAQVRARLAGMAI